MKQDLKGNIELINKNFDELQNRFHVKKIGIFGSAARGTQTEKSDIDIIVEFDEPVGFFTFIQLEDFLSKLLKQKVDLVTKNALKPLLKNTILKETVYA